MGLMGVAHAHTRISNTAVEGVSPFRLIPFCLIPFRLTKMTYVPFRLKFRKLILKDNNCT